MVYMSKRDIIFCSLFLAIGWSAATLPAEEYKVLADREIVSSLPKKWMFENLTDRLFRNADGTILYLGPGEKREFFIIRSEEDVREIKAPSTGKAYLNADGQFAIWYDRLDLGVFFKDGYELQFAEPAKSRFGVAYGATHFYTCVGPDSEIFATAEPKVPILRLADFYLYKIAVAAEDELIVFGWRSKGVRQVREHVIQRWQRIDPQGEYLLMKTFVVPRHYQVMDVDTANPRVLLLNESRLAPQVFDWDLAIDRILPIGTVDSFAFYMNKDFTIGEDMLKPAAKSAETPPSRQ